jgi:hypothetical protein
MRIKNTYAETSEKLFDKVLKQAKKGFNPLAQSSQETIELFRQYDAELVESLEMYINRAIQGKEAEDAGLCEPASVLRGRLVARFSLEVNDGLYSMMDAFIPQFDSYLITLLETVFDMSLLVEQAALRQFHQTYAFQRTIKQVGSYEYIGHYNGWVVHIDVYTGTIRKLKHHFKTGIANMEVDTKTGTVFIEENGLDGIDSVRPLRHIVYRDWQLQGTWVETATQKVEKNKVYLKTQLSNANDDPWGTAFTMLNHQIIALCVFGYDLVKHCRGNTGLLSVDHINKDTLDNSAENLRIISREDNRKVGKDETFKPLDFGQYYKRVESDWKNRNF